MKALLLLVLISSTSSTSFCQYDRNIHLTDSIESTIYDTSKPPVFSLNVIDSGVIKNYFFREGTNEIQGVDIMYNQSGSRILVFYMPNGSLKKITVWTLNDKWGYITTQYYFKQEKIFYVNGIFLNDKDFANVKNLAKKEYETAKTVLKNKEQVQKDFNSWRKKTYTDNPDFKEPSQ
jgi:hypothetical protein